MTTCKVDPAWRPTEVPFGAKPPVPKCATGERQLLVLERDLGSLRVPPFVAFIAFSLLFGLTLLAPALAGARPPGAGRPRHR